MTPHRPRMSMARWHRYAGMTAAMFMAVLAVTGLALNHTTALGLDRRTMETTALLRWYGIPAPSEAVGFAVAEHWITQLGRRVYWDERELTADAGRLVGAVALDGYVAAGFETQLLLLTRDGRLVERLDETTGLPVPLQRLAADGARFAVRANHRDYLADFEALEWRAASFDGTWARPAAMPAELLKTLQARERGASLTLERVVLDIHSGRILGPLGPVLMDAAAALILVLTATGVWQMARRLRRSLLRE